MIAFAVKLYSLSQPAGPTFLEQLLNLNDPTVRLTQISRREIIACFHCPLPGPLRSAVRVQYIISLASGVSEILPIVFTQLPQAGNHSALAPRPHRYWLIVFAVSISANDVQRTDHNFAPCTGSVEVRMFIVRIHAGA